jgi:hypothetical protein
MAWFKEPDFKERQQAAAKARLAALEKFRAKAADPAAAERQQTRATEAAGRTAARQVRATEKAERKVRDTEAAEQAKRDAAIAAERASAERAKRKVALEAEQKKARDERYAARKERGKKKKK